MDFEDEDWLKSVLNHKNLPAMLEKGGTVTLVPVDRDLNGATMGQAWLILKGVLGLVRFDPVEGRYRPFAPLFVEYISERSLSSAEL